MAEIKKQSMAQNQPSAELPQQPQNDKKLAAQNGEHPARLQAPQGVAAKTGNQPGQRQETRPQSKPLQAPQQQAQPSQAVHAPTTSISAQAAQQTTRATPEKAFSPEVRPAAIRQNASEAAIPAAHTQSVRKGSASEQTVGQARQADNAAAQKAVPRAGIRLPGISFSENDTEPLQNPAATVHVAARSNAAAHEAKAIPSVAASAVAQTGRRQAVLQTPDSEDDGAKRTKRAHKDAQQRRVPAVGMLPILALATLAVFLICGAIVFFQLDDFLFGHFEDVEMPNFDGKNVSEIQYNDAYKTFHIRYEDVYTDEEPVGIVIEQTPRAPRRVKENTSVTLYVSAGTRTVEVPSITKMTRAEAKRALEDVGLNPIFKPVKDVTTIPDTILHTEPAAGTSIHYGETVQVYFTRSEDATKIKVPQCVGLATMSEAIRALATVGLNYELSAESVGEGSITAQLPEAGEMVARGTKISLTVSSSVATGLDALPEKQVVGADGHVHAYVASSVVSPNEYSIGYTIYTCSVCNYFYYDDFTSPSAG